jgi:hypothetical protein
MYYLSRVIINLVQRYIFWHFLRRKARRKMNLKSIDRRQVTIF